MDGLAAEFREQMPEALKVLQEQISAQSPQKEHRKAILERLRQIQDLLRFRQYMPKDSGPETITPEEPMPGSGEQLDLQSLPQADPPASGWTPTEACALPNVPQLNIGTPSGDRLPFSVSNRNDGSSPLMGPVRAARHHCHGCLVQCVELC